MQLKRVFKNLISSVLVYGVLLVLNLIVSNVVLHTYGSEMNGLVSSVNQIFSYIAMLEAGIGTATINALYKPISDNDGENIQNVFSTSLRYFRRATVGYLLCTVAAALIWPLAIKTDIGYGAVVAVILLQGVSNALSFCFTSTMTAYLSASGQNYINTYFHTGITLLTYVLKLVICLLGWDYIAISVALVLVNLLKCVGYYLYRKVKCPNIAALKEAVNTMVLPQRNSLLIHEISGAIFASTDVIIISIFCDLKAASVYSVYSIAVVACAGIISQVFGSLTYILGDAYSKRTDFVRVADCFNAMYIPSVFAVYTVVFLLLQPFVSLYTSGMTDANYHDPFFPLLFVLIQLLSSCRIVDGAIIKIASHADKTIVRSIVESGINILLSLVLIRFIGIHGVLLGTILALLYRTNDMILYTNKHIFQRSAWKEYRLHLLNFGLFAGCGAVGYFLNITASSYMDLLIKAVVVFVAVIVVFFAVNFLINRKLFVALLTSRK